MPKILSTWFVHAPFDKPSVSICHKVSHFKYFDDEFYEWPFRDSTFHGDDFVSPFSPYETMIFEGIFPNVRQKESMCPEYIQSVEADRVEDERYTKLFLVAMSASFRKTYI